MDVSGQSTQWNDVLQSDAGRTFFVQLDNDKMFSG
jgi:hypothetical protein